MPAFHALRGADLFRHLTITVGGKLFTLVLVVLVATFAALGYTTIRVHREHLEEARLDSVMRVTELITRSTSHYMLRNDRPALKEIVDTIGQQPGVVSLRIVDAEGGIAFSSLANDVGRADSVPPANAVMRTEKSGAGRVIGVTTPIHNQPSCATAQCHAHPASQKVLGALDVKLSLAAADAGVRRTTLQFIIFSTVATLIALLATAYLVFRIVQRPVRMLEEATVRLRRGELGLQIPVLSRDELGELAESFNQMSRQLCDAREEITASNRTLEERVRRKTAELQRAHEQMLHAEKLTSLGKLAAVVAHEINNPLSGMLTSAKLLRKWLERGDSWVHTEDMRQSAILIESESRRCGEIVRNLLSFARVEPMNVGEVDVNGVIGQCIRLVDHKVELGNVALRLELDENLPRLRGDSGQIEQLLLALIMNAIEAMPQGGVLRIATSADPARETVTMIVEDDGIGIPQSILPHLFEPFVTTKEEKGVGLGLAISRRIVERHHGQIGVQSEAGRGTKFTITIPVVAMTASAPAALLEPIAI